jgi:phosphate transport system permease protein
MNNNNDAARASGGFARERHEIRQMMLRQSFKRKILDKSVTILTVASVLAALVPLGSILVEVVKNGSMALSIEFLTETPDKMGSGEGGIGPSIQGTLIVVGAASLISAPVGVSGGIYLAEFSSSRGRIHNKFANTVRFFSDVMTGLPSIVIGIVGYVVIVLTFGFSVLAGAFALSLIMIPIVVRVTEETIKLVPDSIREAGHALGIPKWKIILFIVLKTSMSGVLTGIVLGISRITGETAPLIMTILGTSLFFSGSGPVDALPLRIWRLASQPYASATSFGWGAALVLIMIVLALSVGLRVLAYYRSTDVSSRRSGTKTIR